MATSLTLVPLTIQGETIATLNHHDLFIGLNSSNNPLKLPSKTVLEIPLPIHRLILRETLTVVRRFVKRAMIVDMNPFASLAEIIDLSSFLAPKFDLCTIYNGNH